VVIKFSYYQLNSYQLSWPVRAFLNLFKNSSLFFFSSAELPAVEMVNSTPILFRDLYPPIRLYKAII